MFTVEESWKMSEPEKVLALIRELGCWRLGNRDGCCCCNFSIRNVDVRISCGKGGEQGVWVGSGSTDYNADLLKPIMEEVVRQCDEECARAAPFIGHVETEYLSF
jgi:hypothetical protein